MLQTFQTEHRINKNRTKYQTGRIGGRHLCNLKDVPLEQKFDLVTGHWVFGYLTNEDLFKFLTRLRIKLIEGRPKG